MINLNGLRGSGKTVNLVKLANTNYKLGHLSVIITVKPHMENIYKNAGLNENIPIITLREYLQYPEKFCRYDIFVDELEYVLTTSLFTQGTLRAFTTEKENVTELKREDWDKNYLLNSIVETTIEEFKKRFAYKYDMINKISKEDIIKGVEKIIKEIQND